MKNLFKTLVFASIVLAAVSCYDDSALNDKVSALESRVSALESKVNSNVSSIQSLLAASSSSDNVTSCTALEDGSGYVITFASGKSITVYNGKDGSSPSISVRMDSDGIYYWTVNGEYLLASGKKIAAESIAPKFKITDNYWYVSVDSGKTWSKIGKAMEETFVIKSINVVDGKVVVVLGDGTSFSVPVASGSDASSIRNLTYVPEYADGAARLFSLDGVNYGELRFEVTPSELVSTLKARTDLKWTFKSLYTKTKAAAGDEASIEVYGVTFQGSYIRVKVRTSDSVPSLEDELGMNASLRVSDSLGTYTSDYIRFVYGGEKKVSDKFDQTRIALSFGVISDVHINLSDATTSTKFVSALNQLKTKAAEKDADGIDAVLVDGDLVDTKSSTAQLAEYKAKYESVFNPVEVPMIYTPGNHEVNWNSSVVSNVAFMRNGFGSNYFLTDKDPEAGTSMECRHCVVGDCDILTILPSGATPVTYSAASKTWLDSKLDSITKTNPNRYVIVLTHPMIYNTVYGSLLGWESGEWSGVSNMWSTKDLTSILEKYPQVMIFGGHLHFPLNDPRSIWQGSFTAFGCSSVRYMALECGGYDTMASITTLSDAHSVSQGYLLQIDEDGNVRITRMDFSKNAVIGDPYDLSFPVSTKAHLNAYSSSARELADEAPATPEVTVSTSAEGVTSVEFGATDDEFVHDFTLTLAKGTETLKTIKVITDFYLNPQTTTMAKTYTRSLGNLGNGSFTLTVVARDSWGKTSSLEKKFTIEGPMNLWTKDSASSKAVEGGEGTVSGEWLSYTGGTLSWTENASGKPRTKTITLPSGASCTVTQLEPKDFKGGWTLTSKRFSNITSIKAAGSPYGTDNVTFGEPLRGETLEDFSGVSHTNQIGVRGLYQEAVMDASVDIDYENCVARVGMFLDARDNAQEVTTPFSGAQYVCFLPEQAKAAFSPTWNFIQVDLDSQKDYCWLWFTASEDFTKLYYNASLNPQKMEGDKKVSNANVIIGITVAASTSASVNSQSVKGANQLTTDKTYPVIYQGNPSDKASLYSFTRTE